MKKNSVDNFSNLLPSGIMIDIDTSTVSKESCGQWGRAWKISFQELIGSALLVAGAPLLVLYFYICAFSYDCSLTTPIAQIFHGYLPLNVLWSKVPSFSWEAVSILLVWMAFQLVLACLPDMIHRYFPSYRGGEQLGATTPSGHRLCYNINGLQAWLISQIFFLGGALYFEWFPLTIIFDHWGSLLWVANFAGFSIAIFAFIKAYKFPSFANDRKFSGSLIYDFFMGIELNPRQGPIDFKLFFNGRPGIVAWTLINISFAAAQMDRYGFISNSMLLVNLFHVLYVLYFFWKESWYLNTIDVHHDHFGWMLGWGDCVWLPYMYTLQGLFLVFHPVQLSPEYAFFVLSLGLFGFWLFVSANNQKDRFRQADAKTLIWKKQPIYISCTYTTGDGELRHSKLLVSGWWGVARHMNYTGDLILSLSYSLACGTSYLFPYFYFIFLAILLVHRCQRDEHRCLNKYGIGWEAYCNKVRYRLLPGIF